MLSFIALALTFNNLNFHKSKYVHSANAISGGLYSNISNISEYIKLKSENKLLAEENMRLRNLLERNKNIAYSLDSTIIDTLKYRQKFKYCSAKIIKNDYNKPFNFLTINKGKKDSLSKEMAVINGKGVIGITDNTSKNYSTVQSILNKNTKINARIKNNNYFGTLRWNANNYNVVQLHDIPRQAVLNIGDTIETGGKSTIFPEGILIGTISKIYKGNTVDNKVDVKLFNDMSNLRHVYVIKSLDKLEVDSLVNTENE